MPHVTIETQFDPKTGKYNLAVYSGSSNNPSMELGEPIYLRKRISEEDVYLAKFSIRDDFIGVGDPVHFAPNCRFLGELGLRGAPAVADKQEPVATESIRVDGDKLLRCLKEDMNNLSSADLCTVANIIFGGTVARSEYNEGFDEDVFILEARKGGLQMDYFLRRFSEISDEKPNQASGLKM